MWKSTAYPRDFQMLGEEVLLVVNGVRVVSGYYAGDNGAHYVWKASRNGFVFWDGEITHWAPLPEPPKEEQE